MMILTTSLKVVKCQIRMMKKLWRSILKGQKTFGLSSPKNTLKMRKCELQPELLPSLLRKCVRSMSRGERNSRNMGETFGAIKYSVIYESVDVNLVWCCMSCCTLYIIKEYGCKCGLFSPWFFYKRKMTQLRLDWFFHCLYKSMKVIQNVHKQTHTSKSVIIYK